MNNKNIFIGALVSLLSIGIKANVEESFILSRNTLLEILKKPTFILDQKLKEKMIDEINYSPLIMINETKAFMHFNQKTWIETELKSHGAIKIIADAETLKNKGLSSYIKLLLHEYVHHLLSVEKDSHESIENENETWNKTNLLYNAIVKNANFPDLLNLNNTTFNAPMEGCHEDMTITHLNPEKGSFTAEYTTQKGHCRIFNKYMDEISPLTETSFIHSRYIYDQMKINFTCQKNDKQKMICFDENYDLTNKICPDFNLKMDPRSKLETSSMILIHEEMSIYSNLSWCVADYSKAALFNNEEVPYFPNQAKIKINEEILKKQAKDNDDNVNLQMFTKEDLPVIPLKLQEVLPIEILP